MALLSVPCLACALYGGLVLAEVDKRCRQPRPV
jgi:hypothetical protein